MNDGTIAMPNFFFDSLAPTILQVVKEIPGKCAKD